MSGPFSHALSILPISQLDEISGLKIGVMLVEGSTTAGLDPELEKKIEGEGSFCEMDLGRGLRTRLELNELIASCSTLTELMTYGGFLTCKIRHVKLVPGTTCTTTRDSPPQQQLSSLCLCSFVVEGLTHG
jgi:hypothetical protein